MRHVTFDDWKVSLPAGVRTQAIDFPKTADARARVLLSIPANGA